MLRVLESFTYIEPQTAGEALKVMSDYGAKAKILAGGTDLLVSMKKKEISPKYIVCIKNISELDYIKYNQEDGLIPFFVLQIPMHQ